MITRRAVARLLGVTIAGLIALSGPLSSVTQAAAGADIADSADSAAPTALVGLELTLTKVSPSALTPKTNLVITGIARNLTGQPMPDVAIRLRLRTHVLAGRDDVDGWLDGSDQSSASTSQFTPSVRTTIASIGAHAQVVFAITVPAGHLGLYSGSDFGPRALMIEAREKGVVLDQLRTTIVWVPNEQISRTRLTLLVPITATTASTQAGAPTQAIANSLTPSGRLQRVLKATTDPAIAWAIDPAVLEAVQRLGTQGISRQAGSASNPDSDDPTASAASSPTPSPSASTATSSTVQDAGARSTAQNWLAQFRAQRVGRSVFGLPFADPDLSSLLSTEKSLSLLRHSDELGRTATMSALGAALDTSVAWPGDGLVTPAAVSALARSGRTAVLLASANQRPDPPVDYTPSGRSTLRAGGRTLTGLLYDEDLSALVTAGGASTQNVADVQTLLAQLAAITLERPNSTRQVLAVTPRSWNPAQAGVQSMMSALHAAPWVSLRDISTLRRASSPPRSAPVYPATAVNAQLPIGQITSALAMSRKLDNFGPALVHPEPVIEPLREQIASMLSVNWRNDRTEMSDQRSQVAAKVNTLVGGVRLQVGSRQKLFTARSAPIPLTVTNDTAYSVTVFIRLTPQSGQLRINRKIEVDADPHTQVLARVPAKAVANGNVVVEADLLAGGGQLITGTQSFTVRVRPNWESWGLIGSAAVLGLMLVIGLLRSIRRHRRPRVPLDSVPDVDELATRRASAAALTDGGEEARPGENPRAVAGVGNGSVFPSSATSS